MAKFSVPVVYDSLSASGYYPRIDQRNPETGESYFEFFNEAGSATHSIELIADTGEVWLDTAGGNIRIFANRYSPSSPNCYIEALAYKLSEGSYTSFHLLLRGSGSGSTAKGYIATISMPGFTPAPVTPSVTFSIINNNTSYTTLSGASGTLPSTNFGSSNANWYRFTAFNQADGSILLSVGIGNTSYVSLSIAGTSANAISTAGVCGIGLNSNEHDQPRVKEIRSYAQAVTNKLVDDWFLNVDNTLLNAHTPDNGDTWVYLTGSGSLVPEIVGNKIYPRTTNSIANCISPNDYLDKNNLEATIIASINTYSNWNALGVCARFSTTDISGYRFIYASSFGEPILQLQKFTSGTATILGSNLSVTLGVGRYEMSIRAEGSTIRCKIKSLSTNTYLNFAGEWVSTPSYCITCNDTTYSSGSYGLSIGCRTTFTENHIENFIVKTITNSSKYGSVKSYNYEPRLANRIKNTKAFGIHAGKYISGSYNGELQGIVPRDSQCKLKAFAGKLATYNSDSGGFSGMFGPNIPFMEPGFTTWVVSFSIFTDTSVNGILCGTVDNVTSYIEDIYINSNADGTVIPGMIEIQVRDSSGAVIAANINVGSSLLNNGSIHTLVCVFTSNTTFKFWLDGTEYSATYRISGTYAYTNSYSEFPLWFHTRNLRGTPQLGSAQGINLHTYVRFHKRFTDSENAAISRNPYGLVLESKQNVRPVAVPIETTSSTTPSICISPYKPTKPKPLTVWDRAPLYPSKFSNEIPGIRAAFYATSKGVVGVNSIYPYGTPPANTLDPSGGGIALWNRDYSLAGYYSSANGGVDLPVHGNEWYPPGPSTAFFYGCRTYNNANGNCYPLVIGPYQFTDPGLYITIGSSGQQELPANWPTEDTRQPVLVLADSNNTDMTRVFINNTLASSSSVTGTTSNWIRGLLINSGTGWNRQLNGHLYCGAIFDRVLTDSERAKLVQNPWRLFSKENNAPLFVIAATSSSYTVESDISTADWTLVGGSSFAEVVGETEYNSETYAQSTNWTNTAICTISAPMPVGDYTITINGRYVSFAGSIRVLLLNDSNTIVGTSPYVLINSTAEDSYIVPITSSGIATRIKLELQG